MKKIFQISISLWAILLLSSFAIAASVETVVVESKGSGMTREDAINAALVEAVAQVNGTDVSSTAAPAISITGASREQEIGDTIVKNSKVTIGASSTQNIQANTRGSVQKYNIISEGQSKMTEGMIDVLLSVTVIVHKESEQIKRKRIAVFPFRYKDNTANYIEFSDLLGRELVNFLTQTRSFAILDRDYLAEKSTELNLLESANSNPTERARIGNTIGSDYIIAGTLLSVYGVLESNKIPYTNEFKKTIKVEAAFSWRIIDVATGQIVFAKNTEFKHAARELGEDGKWMRLPASTMSKEIARNIMDIIYPLMPVSYKDGRLLIPQGGETVSKGQLYTLIKYGDIVYSPYTKEAVAREELPVGLVEIVQVNPKISYAKILETTLGQATLNRIGNRQYILRLADKETMKRKADEKKPAPVKTQQPNW